MADIFEGSESTFTPVAGDYIRSIDDPTGTPISGNVTYTQLVTLLNTLIGGGPGTDGNVLTASGGAWTRATPAAGGGDWTTATGTWSYSSSDAPTFVASVNNDQTAIIYPGQRLSLTQTTEKFFIVTAVGAYSGGATLITMYGGTDYTLANAAITSPKWSNVKAPSRFPMSPLKWTQSMSDSSERTQASAAQFTWYNLNSNLLSVPIGLWRLTYKAGLSQNTSGNFDIKITLSTANNSESDADFSNLYAPCAQYIVIPCFCSKVVACAAKTPYYFNTSTLSLGTPTLVNPNNKIGFFIKAECAYL